MATIFKYNETYYQATNLDKKLKRLKIPKDKIEILFEGELSQSELEKKYLELSNSNKEEIVEDWYNTKLYYYFNKSTGESIISIYPTLEDLPNADDYEQTTKEYLESYWNKTR